MMPAHIAEVAWYVTGRFDSGTHASGQPTPQDVGYFLHLQGIAGSLSAGDPTRISARILKGQCRRC